MLHLTWLEEKAKKATELSCFPINLVEIRSKISLLLSQVQRYGFFNEYTNHDFEHVSSMLKMAEWLIPSETKERLTAADCLFLTLSIYFHDLGLLITQDEFKNRMSNPEYNRFLEDQRSNIASYMDFDEKLNMLGVDGKERFLYQEYVRKNHGSRVKSWIEGSVNNKNLTDHQIRKEIHDLIGKLDNVVKQGLSIVCESHTIDDITDLSKYRVSMPYGETHDETVNLQYVAIILRVVDLLQITKNRAPSILYRIIDPKDPISQVEWQKQNAVRTIRAATGKDSDGNASELIQSDTIEVFATFENSDGFFGLTSYLTYVRKQLELCHEALNLSEKLLSKPLKFPWKKIDDSGVEAVGFLTQSFGFELDQHKILDLLTGHTLYNDSNVVIRELTQNALDAVRLQAYLSGNIYYKGKISIVWNSQQKTLEVSDNGTGMSQSIIEGHLLKVGSSRYQDEKFREKHPDFSSISRFGIGVLSAFMVADNVEITTCSLDDELARQISLRSVHGKYLIKTLDKISYSDEIGVVPHGTRIKLKLRTSAQIDDILKISKQWLMFPKCSVTVKIDDEIPISIGFNTPKEALEHYIQNNQLPIYNNKDEVKVKEFTEDGVTLAFAVVKDSLFKDWSFIQYDDNHYIEDDDSLPTIGLCIEGVGVDFNTPGFKKGSILALANITGKNAPKTNVARSAIEDTEEYKQTLSVLYKLYCEHISSEIERFKDEHGYSISRAADQAPYILEPLAGDYSSPVKSMLLDEELSNLKVIIIEENGIRINLSFNDLKKKNTFTTISSPLFNSIEFFIREAPNNISAMSIINHIRDKDKDFLLPESPIMCNFDVSYRINDLIRSHFEPTQIVANERSRKLTLKWTRKESKAKWMSSSKIFSEATITHRNLRLVVQEILSNNRDLNEERFFFPISKEIEVSNLEAYGTFNAHKDLYIKPTEPFADFLYSKWNSNEGNKIEVICAHLALFIVVNRYNFEYGKVDYSYIERIAANSGFDTITDLINFKDFFKLIATGKQLSFNAFAWERNQY